MAQQPQVILMQEPITKKTAQQINIDAAKSVADAVRTTLGPKGSDKMLVDKNGKIVITNDGVTILQNMQIKHPAAQMVVEVAETQNREVGDGTTTAVVVTGELLKKAEDLLNQEIHQTLIVKGYRMARDKALEVLDSYAKPVSLNSADSSEILLKLAATSMTGKASESSKHHLANISLGAVRAVADERGVDFNNIKLVTATGGAIEDSELVQGIVVDRERSHSAMPVVMKDAKIALLDVALEVKETETDAEIRITSPEQLQAFLNSEATMLKEMVAKIEASGANVVFTQRGIDDIALNYLTKKGILASRRVKKGDMEKLAKATGAKVISNLDDIEASDLGFAGLVEEKKVAGQYMLFVKECRDPKAVTILIKGGTDHVVEEIERAVDDAVKGIIAALEHGKVVPGGGAPEIEVARKLREYAQSVGGREQLAITAFADALEVIPRVLAQSAGMDAIDTIVELRSRHDGGEIRTGVNAMHTGIADMWQLGVVEPLKTKTQVLKSASEVTEMLLRIDDVIEAKQLEGE